MKINLYLAGSNQFYGGRGFKQWAVFWKSTNDYGSTFEAVTDESLVRKIPSSVIAKVQKKWDSPKMYGDSDWSRITNKLGIYLIAQQDGSEGNWRWREVRHGLYSDPDRNERAMDAYCRRTDDMACYGRIRTNPPFYAHNLYEKKTHGLSLKQMRRLYAMVSRGNQKAITYARNVLGIPFSESPSQVKAVVLHHVRDLAERRVRRNPGVPGMFTPTGGVLEIKQTGYYDSDFEGKAQLLKKGEIVNIVATTHQKRGGKIYNYWVVKTSDGKRAFIPVEFGSMISWARVRRNPHVIKGGRRILAGYAKHDIKLLGTGLKIDKGDLVLLEPATNIPGGGYFARPAYPTGIWTQVSEDDSILIRPSEFKSDITFKRPVFGSKSFERMIRRRI